MRLTEIEKEIARLEELSRRFWRLWKKHSNKVSLYHYKQANRKIRQLKGLMK